MIKQLSKVRVQRNPAPLLASAKTVLYIYLFKYIYIYRSVFVYACKFLQARHPLLSGFSFSSFRKG